MTRSTRIRFVSFLIMMGVLVGIIATPTAQQNAWAAVCCTACDQRIQNCYDGIPNPQGYYPECIGDIDCCMEKVQCWKWCNDAC